MAYRHGDDWAVGMVGGSAVRAEIENAARCVVMIVLSMTLMVGLLPLAPGFAPAAQAAGEEEILAARGEQEVEPLAADTDEGQTAELL